MLNYDLILVTTHQDDLYIYKLLDSIKNNLKNIKIYLIIVSQECKINFDYSNPLLTVTILDEVKMGLSKARNIALKYLIESNVSAQYIMFPDDDSSFDEVFFINFPIILDSKKNYITPIYNEGTKDLYLGKNVKQGSIITQNQHTLIGSPNQIICYEKNKSELHFNEELGVGAKYGSCEDFDLFLRLNNSGKLFYYNSKIYSYHPSKSNKKSGSLKEIIARYKSYSPGLVYIIKNYKTYNLIPNFLIRPFGAGILNILKLNIKMAIVYIWIFCFRIKLLITNF